VSALVMAPEQPPQVMVTLYWYFYICEELMEGSQSGRRRKATNEVAAALRRTG
jgi:hypothetical protein